MASTTDLALLALRVYSTPGASEPDPLKRDTEKNRPAVAAGWTELEWHTDEADGFSYGVYGNGTEIVLAYAGTGPGLNVDWIANATNGIGLSSTQTTKAALAYLLAKQQYGSNITLTGHSLGGGLASIIAVWFDRPATVFDEAPFELTARNPLVIGATYAALITAGFDVGAFSGYNGISNFAAREANVRNYFTQGEALLYLRLAWPSIVGSTDDVIAANIADMTSADAKVELHSQALLAALVMSQNFQQATYASTRVLPLLVDGGLYAYSTKGDKENVLINFIRSEQGTGKKLTHFSIDFNKLGAGNVAALSVAAQNAVTAQAIEWYYWQGSVYAGQEFFAVNGALLQYTTAQGAGLLANSGRTGKYVAPWLTEQFTANGGSGGLPFFGSEFEQWSVGTGAAVTATALDGTKTQMFIGQGNADTFTGGDKDDVFFAGAGNDSLTGGLGNDRLYGGADDDVLDGGGLSDYLYGGAGTDTYKFTGSFGSDWIIDSDGQGKIEVDGTVVSATGAKKAGPTTNAWSTDQWAFTLVPNGSGAGGNDLILQRDSSLNQIRIKNWVDGQLGISLGTDVAAPAVDNTFTGDFAKATNAEGTAYLTSNGRYVDAGAQAGAQDLINGSTLADAIAGGGGNDGLAGGDGDDLIEGGAGSDVLLGGWGADTLRGGESNDFIFGSSSGAFSLPTSVDYTPIASQGAELARGFSWVVYDPAGSDGNGVDAISFAGMGSVFANGEADGNLIEGGAGNDYIIAGSGEDIVFGGADNDSITGLHGSDVLLGEDGNDTLRGDGSQPVNGTYYGTYVPLEWHGNDVLSGGAGNDILLGQGNDDILFGGADDDKLWGDDRVTADTPIEFHGNDLLFGGSGKDTLVGGGRDDELYGEAGDDELWGDERQSRVDVSAHNDNTLNLADQRERCPAHSVRGLTCVDASWHWLHFRRRPVARSPVCTSATGSLS